MRKFLHLSLTPKVTLTFVVFAFVLLLTVGVLAYRSGRNSLEHATISDLLSTAIEKEAALETWIARAQTRMANLSKSPFLRERIATLRRDGKTDSEAGTTQLARDQIIGELSAETGDHDIFAELIVLEPVSGEIIAATNPREEGTFKEDRPYFINGQRGPYVQNVYFSLECQCAAMTASAPILTADGQVLAVLAGRLNLREMGEIIRRSSGLRTTFDAYLVNTASLFVTQPRQITDPAILQRGNNTTAVSDCLAGNSSSSAENDYRGLSVISVYRWLPARNLCLIVEVDQWEAFEAVQTFGSTLLMIAGIALLGASLLAVTLARSITRPVLALKEVVTKFGQGQQVRFPQSSNDELGALAREFNTMANAIVEKETLLQNYTKDLEERVRERTSKLTFLSNASRTLSESFDYSARLKQAARLAVPEIADWCSVDILDKEKKLQRLVVVHSDPQKIELAFELERRFPANHNAERGTYHVLRTGKSEFIPEITDQLLVSTMPDPEMLNLVRELGLRSIMIVPLIAFGEPLGTLTLVMAESGRQYDLSDLALAEDLARRAALLIANARLYQETKELNADLERRVQERTEQLRLSEEKFFKAFKDSPAAISIASLPDGHWIDVNEAVEKMTGFSREELLGRTSTDIGLVDNETRLIILQALRDHGAVRNVEIQMHTKSNEVIDVLLSVEQVELNGKPSLLAIQYDITERKRVEREIRRLNDDLEQRRIALEATNRELEAFSYSVSHDLRAPLRSVDGFSQALLEDYYDSLDATGRDFLTRIRTESQRMGHLIDDLIGLSRYTRTEMEMTEVNLSQIAREIAADLQSKEPDRKVKTTIQDHLTACGDARLIRVALQNLLANAWKFTSKQPQAHIEFGCTSLAENGAKEYFVRDNGAGFDMNYAHKLFGAFQRLHAMTEFEGTGIGLATVQRIMHRHGGSIRAQGAVNQGAVFYFTLRQGNCD